MADGDMNKNISYWQKTFEHWWQDKSLDDGAHDMGHFRRVYKNACQIAQEEGDSADKMVLLAAAYFHDVVNPPKNAPDRHLASYKSAEMAKEILSSFSFPDSKINQVYHAITTHSFSAGLKPETQEAKILQDADRLEALGALGVARNMYVSGMMGSLLFDPQDPLAENRPLDDKRYALDHFEVKLFKLSETMQTLAGKRIAEERTAFLRLFRDQLLKEVSI